ncbi:hypothetical protein J2T02_002604 [Chitinophaga terrae (ex Kim and Jung 2007)]|uniref:hypothetical protein n=1 Tax=Chitinophaga terrae (ex Kim and Jung 2007) TaxID=408074 RepID=UPI0027820714|nr:hypothetical protein [Chitinophaga terrae (ex Kim and Jung 2007)]MDQ0107485.1 hypothetical protein [Chitinophaga terrae (ex Kim and Jung 2007)]
MDTLSKSRAVHATAEPPARRRRGKTNEDTRSASGYDRWAFLKYRFSQLWDRSYFDLPVAGIERAFYASVGHFETLYGVQFHDRSRRAFPDNVLEDFEKISGWFSAHHPGRQVITGWSGKGYPCLTTYNAFDTGGYLYYIPIKPLYERLKDKQRPAVKNILLSIFAYLYKVANISMYSDHRSSFYNTFFSYTCMTVEDEYDFGEEEKAEFLQHYHYQLDAGEKLRAILGNPCHLRSFRRRLDALQKVDYAPKTLVQIAQTIYDMYEAYLDRSILKEPMTTTTPFCYDEQAHETVWMEDYLAFVWDLEDKIVFEHVMSVIQWHLEEKVHVEAPVAFQVFDRPQKQIAHDLSFAAATFNIVERLIETLISEL